jgi:hypothetical protein
MVVCTVHTYNIVLEKTGDHSVVSQKNTCIVIKCAHMSLSVPALYMFIHMYKYNLQRFMLQVAIRNYEL